MEPKRTLGKLDVEAMVRGLRPSSKPAEALDGSRVHLFYRAMPSDRKVNERAVTEAKRAEDLGIERQRYTGVVSKVWQSKTSDLLLTLRVELERASPDGKPCFRTFNISKGDVVALVVLSA